MFHKRVHWARILESECLIMVSGPVTPCTLGGQYLQKGLDGRALYCAKRGLLGQLLLMTINHLLYTTNMFHLAYILRSVPCMASVPHMHPPSQLSCMAVIYCAIQRSTKGRVFGQINIVVWRRGNNC